MNQNTKQQRSAASWLVELVTVDGLYRRFVVERKQAAGWKV